MSLVRGTDGVFDGAEADTSAAGALAGAAVDAAGVTGVGAVGLLVSPVGRGGVNDIESQPGRIASRANPTARQAGMNRRFAFVASLPRTLASGTNIKIECISAICVRLPVFQSPLHVELRRAWDHPNPASAKWGESWPRSGDWWTPAAGDDKWIF